MAGSKKKKLHKPSALPSAPPPPPPVMTGTSDDDELMNDLLAELDSRDETVQSESASVLNEMQLSKQADQIQAGRKQDAKGRFKARQARKAAAIAQNYSQADPLAEARLEKEAKDEEKAIKRICDELDVRIHEVNPDGHCLFSAVADQLALLSIIPCSEANYVAVRLAASNYIYSHPDEFIPFLPSSGRADGSGAQDAGFMTPQEFERYCVTIRDTAVWGGEPEILALSRVYNVPIHVVQGWTPPVVIHNPRGAPSDGDIRDKRVVRISYHRRMYGLGEHYNSLRPKGGITQISQVIQGILS